MTVIKIPMRIDIISAMVSAESIFFQSIYSYPGIIGVKYYIGIFY